MLSAVKLAKLRWRRSCHINFFARRWTVGGSELKCFGVDEDGLHSFGYFELFDVAIGGQRRGAKHEVGPDGRGRRAARQPQIALIVEADPDDAKQIRGETREPAVGRRARFSCRWESETPCADTRARAPVKHIYQETVDKVRDPRIESRASLRRESFEHRAIGAHKTVEKLRPRPRRNYRKRCVVRGALH